MEKERYLDYRVEIIKLPDDEGGGYLAVAPSLPGCMSDGETAQKALENIQDAIKCWIETAEEIGRDIPKPDVYKAEEEYSGKLTLRLPKSLHKQVTERAIKEDCSINQLIQTYIAMGVGYDWGREKISIKVEYNEEKSEEKHLKFIQQKMWQTSSPKSIEWIGLNPEVLMRGREVK